MSKVNLRQELTRALNANFDCLEQIAAQQEEIKRLKGMIENAFAAGHEAGQNGERFTDSWEEYKRNG